ncbi:L-threonylcarbamoyladenylate synthase [Halorhodospira halophila]|uniref:Threonylcarbamoyl-AMP synthase n=1 Tax=Halorhodospira halophila (strain DSM 244 / SL1) TaxID=349124 RepID=TSAC_HALHL|nr:L-threonylcarbamoyladenylate synthase [Halorhodospira halophila]A1WZH9.1 RecName: Full=Threonylcarbamoyl-AMP synthase; Short=TC-AMP synthase; AltName: Full=L-threonylcarbamoyladenylate synthase; AltName: Full=t(6)A37 threonylcarbamoyladenosine biosynthesis protein TsaC; AltName: Full=tRNA threonylcarbamoyladenosine biosynthesis protein TsaC [Halorhodospira halophila SL1]ABM63091.1 translation factor SUA5 [Halorhodospira halophila SL1]MBK1727787.1 threonylcarbamoyl-AMP synthase [Halorhodospira
MNECPPGTRPFRVRHAAAELRQGGVVAYPTEAVWGLGCDPRNADAVARLLALKGRPERQGLILIAAESRQLARYLAPLPAEWAETIQASWPGPMTWVLPASTRAPRWVSGGRDTLAVRVTAHPVAAALCSAFGGALVSTSANPSARRPARSVAEVRRYFGTRIDALVPGRLGGLERPTPIRDGRSGAYLRR